MAIKCFKQVDSGNAYVDSRYICCVRECCDEETAIDVIDGGTIYTKESVESVVCWWKEQER